MISILRNTSWNTFSYVQSTKNILWRCEHLAPAFLERSDIQPFANLLWYYDGESHIVEVVLRPEFRDPLPYRFLLQMSDIDGASEDYWVTIDESTEPLLKHNLFAARLISKSPTIHYRVILITPLKRYVSESISSLGGLDWYHWSIRNEVIRKEILRLKTYTGQKGWWIKRRRSGPPCPTCYDPHTGDTTNSHCPDCYGTGILKGYHKPIANIYLELSPTRYAEKRHPSLGTTLPIVHQARMPAYLFPQTFDVWVSQDTNYRFLVHTVQVASQVRNVPIVYQIELRLIPAGDIIYTIPITE